MNLGPFSVVSCQLSVAHRVGEAIGLVRITMSSGRGGMIGCTTGLFTGIPNRIGEFHGLPHKERHAGALH